VWGLKRLPNQEYVQVDTSNILFICGGSFEGLQQLIEERMGSRSVGFMAEEQKSEIARELEVLQRVTPGDLDRFGLIPEFIGRLPVLAVMDNLGVDDLVQVLKEPKNSLVRQYEKLFKFEKVKLTFTDDALIAIAEKASTRKAGARGLRTILEKVMLDVMFDIPSEDNIREVVITGDVINDGADPVIELVRDYGVPG
jgi:ATP-dependent Clp protease ATP-binding subunit ClpX